MGMPENGWRRLTDDDAVVAAIVSKGFRVVKDAAFEILHPRGKDGRFLSKNDDVSWTDSSGIMDTGKVSRIVDKDHIEVVNRRGQTSIRKPKELSQATKAIAKMDHSGLKTTDGRQHGSNPGEVMTDPTSGQKYYVKTLKSKKHVASEVLTHKLYARAGAGVPQVAMSPDGTKFITKLEESSGWTDLSSADKAEYLAKINDNFVIDAWLANWDAPANDNIRVNKDGVPLRVDTGGALDYRAQGAPKPDVLSSGHLSPVVSELKSLRSAKNRAGSRLYSGLTKEQELDGAKRIMAIPPETIRKDVKQAGLDDRLADDLIARRAWLSKHYKLDLPEETEAGKKHLAERNNAPAAADKADAPDAKADTAKADAPAAADTKAPEPAAVPKIPAADIKTDTKPDTKADTKPDAKAVGSKVDSATPKQPLPKIPAPAKTDAKTDGDGSKSGYDITTLRKFFDGTRGRNVQEILAFDENGTRLGARLDIPGEDWPKGSRAIDAPYYLRGGMSVAEVDKSLAEQKSKASAPKTDDAKPDAPKADAPDSNTKPDTKSDTKSDTSTTAPASADGKPTPEQHKRVADTMNKLAQGDTKYDGGFRAKELAKLSRSDRDLMLKWITDSKEFSGYRARNGGKLAPSMALRERTQLSMKESLQRLNDIEDGKVTAGADEPLPAGMTRPDAPTPKVATPDAKTADTKVDDKVATPATDDTKTGDSKVDAVPAAVNNPVPSDLARTSDKAMDLAPGAKVWLKKKPDGTRIDTWIVKSVAADGSAVRIEDAGGKGKSLNVPVAAVQALREHGGSVFNKYGSGETVDLGDKVSFPDGRRGTVAAVHPMYVTVVPDGDGKKEVILSKKLGLVKANAVGKSDAVKLAAPAKKGAAAKATKTATPAAQPAPKIPAPTAPTPDAKATPKVDTPKPDAKPAVDTTAPKVDATPKAADAPKAPEPETKVDAPKADADTATPKVPAKAPDAPKTDDKSADGDTKWTTVADLKAGDRLVMQGEEWTVESNGDKATGVRNLVTVTNEAGRTRKLPLDPKSQVRTAVGAKTDDGADTLEKQAARLKYGRFGADKPTTPDSDAVAALAKKVRDDKKAPTEAADAPETPAKEEKPDKSAIPFGDKVSDSQAEKFAEAAAKAKALSDKGVSNVRAKRQADKDEEERKNQEFIRRMREEQEKADQARTAAEKAKKAEADQKRIRDAAAAVKARNDADAAARRKRIEEAKANKKDHDATRDEVNAALAKKRADDEAARVKAEAEAKAAQEAADAKAKLDKEVAAAEVEAYKFQAEIDARRKAKELAEQTRLAAEAKKAKAAVAKAKGGNPYGDQFDLAKHDFTTKPAPKVYSTTYGQDLYVLFTPNKTKATVVFPDGSTETVAQSTLRVPGTVDPEGIKALELAKVQASKVTSTKPASKKPTKKELEQQKIDQMTRAEALGLMPEPIPVKYATMNADSYKLQPGDTLWELKGTKQDRYRKGVFLIRDNVVHHLGSNLQTQAPPWHADANDQLMVTDLVGSMVAAKPENVKNITPPAFAKASQILDPHLGASGLGLERAQENATLSLVPGFQVPYPANKIPNPKSFLYNHTPGQQTPVFVQADKNDLKSPIFLVGSVDDEYNSTSADRIKRVDEWIELTQAQRDHYFHELSGYSGTRLVPRSIRDSKTDGKPQTPSTQAELRLDDGSLVEIPYSYYSAGSNWVALSEALNIGAAERLLQRDKRKQEAIALNTSLTPAKVKAPTATAAPGEVLDVPKPNEKVVGEVAEGHYAKHIPSKGTPGEALAYKLPGTQANLDDGTQDKDLLAVMLRHANFGADRNSRSRSAISEADDGTAHKDPLMYEYGRNLGADDNVVRMAQSELTAYAKQGETPILYRGIGEGMRDPEADAATKDFREGTVFIGAGVNGQGHYTTNKPGYALTYAGNRRTRNVTRLTPKHGANIVHKFEASHDHVNAMQVASDNLVQEMAKLGVAPSLKEMVSKGNIPKLTPKDRSVLASAGVNVDSTKTWDQEKAEKLAAFIVFYQNKGYSLVSVNDNLGYYSASARTTLAFSKPNPAAHEGNGSILITLDTLRSVSGSERGTAKAEIVDYNGDTRVDASGKIKGRNFTLARTSVSESLFSDGFSHPTQVHDFIKKVNSKYADSEIVKPYEEDQKITEAADLSANPHFKEMSGALGTAARLAYIQDIGRYGQAAGIDVLLTPFNRDLHYIFTNRNAMVQQRY